MKPAPAEREGWETAVGRAVRALRAGAPGWVTPQRMQACLRTGRTTREERAVLRAIVEGEETGPEGGDRIRAIVEEEGLDPGRTRALLVECGVSSTEVLGWLEAEARRRAAEEAEGGPSRR